MPIPTESTSRSRQALARAALIHTWPLYEMRRVRASTTYAKLPGIGSADAGRHWCNVFAHRRELLRPGVSKVVTPNNDTLYSGAWIDLSQGRVVIDLPDMGDRYHVLGILDWQTNPIAHIGSRLLPSGAKTVLLSGPGAADEATVAWEGVHVRSPTRWVWVIGRILVYGLADLPTVHLLQDGLKIRAFDALGRAPVQFVSGCDPDEPLSGQHFATQVNAALFEAANDRGMKWDLIRTFGAIGIGPNLSPSDEQLALIDELIVEVGEQLQVPRTTRTASQWEHLPVFAESFGDDDLLRAHISRQYIGMVESKEAVYPLTWHDGRGRRLSGENDYVLYFGSGRFPPVGAFWSLTIYDSATCRLIDNPINRFAIGDRTPGLVFDAQGGLRIFIGHRSPLELSEQSNWLPAPAGEFYLCLRAYLPSEELLSHRYELPAVQRVESAEMS